MQNARIAAYGEAWHPVEGVPCAGALTYYCLITSVIHDRFVITPEVREGAQRMRVDRTSTAVGNQPTGTHRAGMTWADGAAVHPRFLHFGPWGLSLVVATLFALSFATSYAALYDYALQLEFGREFAIVFPLVLDAVISVLAVTVLLERALRRRMVTIRVWQVTLRWPTWPSERCGSTSVAASLATSPMRHRSWPPSSWRPSRRSRPQPPSTYSCGSWTGHLRYG